MLQTLNPYTSTAKTAQIMARYRPIAPRPEATVSDNPSMTPKSRQSPYMRNVWAELQARPTRTRKRGRTSVGPPAVKRPRTYLQGLSPPCQVRTSFTHYSPNGLPKVLPIPVTTPATLVTLPLLPQMEPCGGQNAGIDLNMAPEEKDFPQKLQGGSTSTNVIAPQAVRPVGSSITVGSIKEEPSSTPGIEIGKKAYEVEKEVESEVLPIVVSDSNNRVRLVNSAYKEMVGQPECSWLDSMVTCEGKHGGLGIACKRICGEVALRIPDSGVPLSSNGFSCLARIEWGTGGEKGSLEAICDGMRLYCESKDYLLAWRFRANEASECASHV